jgi:hypothetical protein
MMATMTVGTERREISVVGEGVPCPCVWWRRVGFTDNVRNTHLERQRGRGLAATRRASRQIRLQPPCWQQPVVMTTMTMPTATTGKETWLV